MALALATLAHAQQPRLFTDSRPAMGTIFTIHLYAPDARQASAHFDAAFDEVERIEEALSNYRPSSELSRINRDAAVVSVTTDPEVFALLQRSLDFSRRSDGAFDITVGPLMRAWGFFRGQGSYPSAEALAAARSKVGWQLVALDPAARTVRFARRGVELDPGGIGKGYAVDRAAALLRESGVTAALIDAGGSTLYAIGTPPGKAGWLVHISQPERREAVVSDVLLRDESLSTSGNYEKFFRLGGRMYCHIMDPRTGEPVQGMMQTTVIAPSATDSDALSTATFVMGRERGAALLKTIPGARALFITGDAGSEHSTAFYSFRWPTEAGLPWRASGPAVSSNERKHAGRTQPQ
ncbi:MAG TPA: FAD:protein FMN transferase [Terriglobales bacterium]|nr:FAD:protein FMN transferase [Terriglobales bacterium]